SMPSCRASLPSQGNLRLKTLAQSDPVFRWQSNEGRYRCTFKATLQNGQWVRDRGKSFLFEKRLSGWAVAGS
ncbi:hypothetical protein, partial [Sphingobium fontiphilum]|uniref:hypothetical protein n=1 Tax=Sphingobium fontiphilum TaxID=944425 RepID=UPI001C8597F0